MNDPLYPGINRGRSRLQFVLLGLLFFAPFVLAYSAYWLFPDWTPQGRTNYGQLLNPTRPAPKLMLRNAEGAALTTDPLRGKWSLVQLVAADCTEACRRELVLTRQTYATLGVKRERVQRLLIAAPGVDLAALKARYAAEQPDLVWLQDVDGDAMRFFAAAPADAALVIDPLGSWLMTYPNATDEAHIRRDFKGMQKDINKLLKLSSIG